MLSQVGSQWRLLYWCPRRHTLVEFLEENFSISVSGQRRRATQSMHELYFLNTCVLLDMASLITFLLLIIIWRGIVSKWIMSIITGARIGIFATELPLKLWSVAHFYTSVVNTNCAVRTPNRQCTCVFVDKLKDMEPAKTWG